MSYNDIGALGATCLIEGLTENKSLVELDLEGNYTETVSFFENIDTLLRRNRNRKDLIASFLKIKFVVITWPVWIQFMDFLNILEIIS